jgi:hypothetical protein
MIFPTQYAITDEPFNRSVGSNNPIPFTQIRQHRSVSKVSKGDVAVFNHQPDDGGVPRNDDGMFRRVVQKAVFKPAANSEKTSLVGEGT